MVIGWLGWRAAALPPVERSRRVRHIFFGLTVVNNIESSNKLKPDFAKLETQP
jgi:hypothetical protein